MNKKVIIYILILLFIPLCLSIYLGYTSNSNQKKPDDIVIYDINNSDKLNINSLGSTSSTRYAYITIFIALVITGGVYLFVASKKE